MCWSVWRVCLARILASRRGDTARIGPTSLYHFHGWFAPARRPSVRFRLRGLPGNPALQREVNLLKPWFDVGVRNRGCTSANVSELDIDQVVEWISEFLADTTPQSSPAAECSLAEPSNLR